MTRPCANRVGNLWLAALISVMAAAAGAEDKTSRRQQTFELYQEAAEMVSAAALHPQSTLEAPGNATVITDQEIQAHGYRTIAEALQSVSGVYFTDDRNYSYIWVRGFGRPGDYNSRVLLMLNGHRLNENVYGGAYMDHIFPVPIESVEKIEVIKGPGAALYGNNAFFAVVNVITKQPGQAPAAQANAQGGSYGTSKAAASVSHAASGSDGFYAAGEYRHMRGQDLEYPAFRSVNNGWAVNAGGEENYNLFSSWAGSGLSLQGAYSDRTKHIPTASFTTQFNNPNEQTDDARGFVELKADRDLSPAIHWNARMYVDQYDYHGSFPMTNAAPPPDLTTNRDYARALWYGEETTLRLAPPEAAHALLLGQDYEQTYDVHTLNFNEDPYQLILDEQHRLDRYAFFAQDEWSLSKALLLTLGARYDHDQSFASTVNPRLSTVIRLRETSTLKLMYGSAFRAPNPYELYGQGLGSYPNTSLKPEKITSYETDWVEQIAPKTSLTAAYFLNDIHDLIDNVADAAGNTQFQNVEHVRSHGLDLSSRWEDGPYAVRAGYVYQQTYEVGGTLLSNSPMHTATAGLVRRWGPWGTTAFDGFFVGPHRTLQGTALPPAATFNLNLSVTPWRDGLRLYFGIFNLFDTRYSVSGSTEHVQDAIPQNGRNFNGGAEYRFQ